MSLFDFLLTNRTHQDVAKELVSMAKENAALRNKVLALEIEIFWMKAAERDTYKPEWMPIESAPLDGTMLLLTTINSDGTHGETDFGCWEWIEDSDWDGAPVYDWSSYSGYIESPTHYLIMSERK